MNASARATDPETSHEAARLLAGLSNLEQRVLDVLRKAPSGLTIDEITTATGLDKVSASPRLRPLCEAGFVFEDGKRAGRSSRKQTIWRAA